MSALRRDFTFTSAMPEFNAHMKKHTDTKFYSSAFFIVMNREKYAGLPPDVRAAVDSLTGDSWVAELGALWNKWAQPVRSGAAEPGHEVIVPDAATMKSWREGLAPVTERYLDELAKGPYPRAREAYRRLTELAR